jgi:hypothetical protein
MIYSAMVQWKDIFKDENFINIYKYLPEENYPKARRFVCGFISITITYLYERIFSKIKYLESTYRSCPSEVQLKSVHSTF